jgi:hypothetical protein
MKPGDRIKKKLVTKHSNSFDNSGVIMEVHEWNYIIHWPDGRVTESPREDIDLFYSVLQTTVPE